MFRDAWNIVRRILFVAGILVSFLVFIELFRAFVFFYRLNHTFGWAFAAVVILTILAVPIYVWRVLASYPRVITPPEVPPLEEAGFKDLRNYCRYLVAYMERLARNPNFEPEQSDRAQAGAREMQEVLGAHPLLDDLRRAIAAAEDGVINPLLEELGDLARKEIRRSVRDVMLGVSLSPYHSVDLVVVLYRNAAMVVRVAGCFASRPNTREQLLVLRDVLRVLVTVNFLYIGRNLVENVFANVPLIGRVVDDIGQGLGAGLFTSAAGHAAIERCAAFRGWDKQQAAATLASQTKKFLGDVRDIFTHDVLPDLRNRIRSEVSIDKADQPGFWDAITGGVNTAVDATSGVIGQLVVTPAVAGTRGAVRAGAAMSRAVSSGGTERRKQRRRRSSMPKRKPWFGTLGQRIKYTFKPPSPSTP